MMTLVLLLKTLFIVCTLNVARASDCDVNSKQAKVEVKTDWQYNQTSWILTDFSTNEVIHEMTGYEMEGTYETTVCLENSKSYRFTILDSFGNGLLKEAFYRLYLNDTLIKEVIAPTTFFKSQETIFCASDEACDDNDPCTINTCQVEMKKCISTANPTYTQQCRSFGNPSFLTIRVVAPDASVTSSIEDLISYMYDSSNMPSLDAAPTMKSQFSDCSYEKFNIVPFTGVTTTGTSITNGVTEITLTSNILARQSSQVANDVLAKAAVELGDIESQFDFVVLCIPPGTKVGVSDNWKAYAFVNAYLSIYNDKNCNYLSVLMHEIGHNLGLSHSNDEKNYGDTSGYMGISYSKLYSPKKCFNGAKSWQLSWYSDKHFVVDLNSFLIDTIHFTHFISVADYDNEDNEKNTMIIKIINSDDGFDYFVAFNRQANMNTDTETLEGANQVLVTKRISGTAYADSFLDARLSDKQEYHIYNVKQGMTNQQNNLIQATLNVFPEISFTPTQSNLPPHVFFAFDMYTETFCIDDSSCNDNNACTLDQCDAVNWADETYCSFTPISCSECGAEVKIKVITNDYPQNIDWSIKPFGSTQSVRSSGFMSNSNTLYENSDCLEYGKYVFSFLYTNTTTSDNSLTFELYVENILMDSDTISLETLIESFFIICSSDEMCQDYDGCSVDTCNLEKSICENTRAANEESCINCSFLSLDIVLDNFPEETKWSLTNYKTSALILSGEPYPFDISSSFTRSTTKSGRSKAPTKSGRRKAPTRASMYKNDHISKGNRHLIEENISERICFEHGFYYHFQISDTFGDGICCSEGNGFFSLKIADSTIVKQGSNFGAYEQYIFKFGACQTDLDCSDDDICTIESCEANLNLCSYSVRPCEECGAMVTIVISTNQYPGGTVWNVMNNFNEKEILRKGPYATAFQTSDYSKCFSYGSYLFTMFDYIGTGSAHYNISVNNNVIHNGNDGIMFEDNQHFGICTTDAHCEDYNECTDDKCNLSTNLCTFEPCKNCDLGYVTINVKTDGYPTETSWELIDVETNIIRLSDGPYLQTQTGKNFQSSICLPAGSYEFAIYDEDENGLSSCQDVPFCNNCVCGYTIKINNEIIKSGLNFSSAEITHFEIKHNVSNTTSLYSTSYDDWYLQYEESIWENVFGALTLNYKLAKGKDLHQFSVNIFDSNCTSMNDERIASIANKSITTQTTNKYDDGIVELKLNSTALKLSSNNSTGEDQVIMKSFCVRAELFLNNMSISFTETKLNLAINLRTSKFSVGEVGLEKHAISEINRENAIQVAACLCVLISNKEYECNNELVLEQNSIMSICLTSPEGMFVKRFENLYIYQDGILKYSPIEEGIPNSLTTTTLSTEVHQQQQTSVISTHLISSFFYEDIPAPLLVNGNVELDMIHSRYLLDGVDSSSHYSSSSQKFSSFHTEVHLQSRPKSFKNSFALANGGTMSIVFVVITLLILGISRSKLKESNCEYRLLLNSSIEC